MDKYIELRKIFAGILKGLGLSDEEVQSLSTFVRTPVEMEKMVNLIEENPNIIDASVFWHYWLWNQIKKSQPNGWLFYFLKLTAFEALRLISSEIAA